MAKERGVLMNQDMVLALLTCSKCGKISASFPCSCGSVYFLKAQTRRPIKLPKGWEIIDPKKLGTITSKHSKKGKFGIFIHNNSEPAFPQTDIITSKLGKVGDLLYVRERARLIKFNSGEISRPYLWNGADCRDVTGDFQFEADGSIFRRLVYPWRLKAMDLGHCCSNGCFKELARIWEEITGVGVERWQDITPEDCIAEGVRKVTKDGKLFKYCIYDKGDYSTVPWSDMPTSPIPVFRDLIKKTYPGSWERNDWVFAYTFKRIEK
jgi:hypothetical protein